MELNIYDADLNALGVIDEITSLLWTRRYWSYGEFKLLLPFSEKHIALLEGQRIIAKRDDAEVGQITYVSIRKNEFGMDEIEVQGRFLTNWIGKRIVLNPIVSEVENSQQILYRIIRENCATAGDRNIPNLIIADDPSTESGIINYANEPFISALFACEGVAKAAKIGFRITTDLRTKLHTFHVYEGRNLTAGQIINPPCVFSQEFDNILEQEFTRSSENLKTAAYVGGEERELTERIVVEVGEAAGLARDEIFINASDIEQVTPEERYVALLRQRGNAELARYEETLNFASRINPYINLTYKKDFDIGDRVTCVDRRWGVKINVRITEITEIYQKDTTEIDVTFGESLPTLTDKLNWR